MLNGTTINSEQPIGHNFQPYTDNGGNMVAVAGKDFVIVASDTRLSEGYSIQTRDRVKFFKLTDSTVLGSTGCWCDVLAFVKVLNARIKLYNYDHRKSMSTNATSQLVSTMLYSKRFFPYYISNIVAGLDENGAGAVYSYDPVGSFDRYTSQAVGSSSPLIQPLLDNQIEKKNQANVEKLDLTPDFVKRVVKDAFISAAERDMYCGDSAVIQLITKDGITEERIQLRKD
ncbi:hypothetical protein RDWZM_009139 [Blomia tropicalis]|uniref:Proteasome subunit beta n=1 Tax=Blomia tropicalis TaxID=40697 RepID=A0A9Q0M5T8_BLOTA|nr:Proteasome subunit beta type-1 [Blomia tropicalis]KAJ6217982.1 hypothetical protein RDWZM_009139 [Blomia tropicalis]